MARNSVIYRHNSPEWITRGQRLAFSKEIGGQKLSFMGRIITLLTPSPIIFRSFMIYCIEAIMGALGLYGIRKMASQRLNQSERSISMDLDQ